MPPPSGGKAHLKEVEDVDDDLGVLVDNDGMAAEEAAVVFGRERGKCGDELRREGTPGAFVEAGREAAVALELFFQAWRQRATALSEAGREIGGAPRR